MMLPSTHMECEIVCTVNLFNICKSVCYPATKETLSQNEVGWVVDVLYDMTMEGFESGAKLLKMNF